MNWFKDIGIKMWIFLEEHTLLIGSFGGLFAWWINHLDQLNAIIKFIGGSLGIIVALISIITHVKKEYFKKDKKDEK